MSSDREFQEEIAQAKSEIHRRNFLKALLLGTISGAGAACTKLDEQARQPLIQIPDGQSVARFPEKSELIMLTDRPPQLETPLFYFREDLTPNEAFFVRWHYAGIPTRVDLDTFKLKVTGLVDNPLSYSIEELKKNFEPTSIVAVAQCSGNSRRYFDPQVPGGQWQNGAVGNAKWTGVPLSALLQKAGIKKEAAEISFAGLDEPPLSNMPKFAKSLTAEHALGGDVLVAYAMNDEPLPMVNGFPLRLVVPGYYATYWVKSLAEISVSPSKFEGYWMKKAYRIPDNKYAEEKPDCLAKDTVPINKMNIRSIFVRPEPNDIVKAGREFELEGLAFDAGSGISKVELSISAGNGIDPGKWVEAQLQNNQLGKYSWTRWKYRWQAPGKGEFVLRVRASNSQGETQTDQPHWNKSGYMRNVIESIRVTVV